MAILLRNFQLDFSKVTIIIYNLTMILPIKNFVKNNLKGLKNKM